MNKLLAIIIVLCCALNATSQHSHGDEEHIDKRAVPKHGGQISDAGKYKLEIVTSPFHREEKLAVYVLKKNYKEMELKEASATIVLKYQDGRTESVTMQKHSNRFTTESIDLMQPANISFTILLETKTITASFYYEGLTQH